MHTPTHCKLNLSSMPHGLAHMHVCIADSRLTILKSRLEGSASLPKAVAGQLLSLQAQLRDRFLNSVSETAQAAPEVVLQLTAMEGESRLVNLTAVGAASSR